MSFELGKKNQRGFDYRIGEILYLVDWEPYLEILQGGDIQDLMAKITEVYIYRIWLYNYCFRRVVADNDLITKKMLRELVNEIKTLGNPLFFTAMLGPETDSDRIASISAHLMDRIYDGLELYDQIAIRYQDNDESMEATVSYLAKRLELNLKKDMESNRFIRLLNLINRDVTSKVGNIAIEAARAELR